MTQATAPRQIWISAVGLVDQGLVQRFLATFAGLLKDGFNDVHLMIHSSGGFINDCVAIANLLSVVPVPVSTYNIGHVGSSAVPIYLAGRRRLAAHNATFMIHSPFLDRTSGTSAAVAAASESLRIDEQRMEKLLRTCLSLPEEKWRQYAMHDLTLTSHEFLQYGGCHEIGTFAPPAGSTFISV